MTDTGIPIEALLEQESWARRLAWDLARGDGALADDLVQGAYTAALTRPPAPAVPVRRWLANVMRNLARHDRRSHANRAAVEQVYAASRRHDEAAAHAAGALEIRRQLQEMVEELPELYRTRIVERYVEGLKPHQIASRADVSVETIKSQLVRGRAMLRDALDRQSGGDRNRWMAAIVPLLRGRRGIATPLHAHGIVVGLVASASVVAGVILAARLLSSSQSSAAGHAGPAAMRVADGTPASGEHGVAGLRRPVDVGPTEAADGEKGAALTDAPSAATTTTTLWEVRDGNRRRGVAWSEDGTELAVVNYEDQQVEIWSADGRMTAKSKSSLHLSEIAMFDGTIWATHPGGELARLDVETLEWGPSIKVGAPDKRWLTNALGLDRFGRMHVARGGGEPVQTFDPRDGRCVGQWVGVPDEVQFLKFNEQSFALGYNQVDDGSVVAIGARYMEDLESFQHRPAIRLNGGLCDMQFLADRSLVCLVEAEGFLRFHERGGGDERWVLSGFMPLPEYGPHETENRVERFAIGGASGQLLAMGRMGGVTVQVATDWEKSGLRFDRALREIVVAMR